MLPALSAFFALQGPPSGLPWSEAARQLAEKIMTFAGPLDEVALTVRNISALSPNEVLSLRRALEAELQGRGVRRFSAAEAATQVVVTLSENLQSYVLTAEMQRGENRSVVLVSQQRAPAAELHSQPPLAVLEKKPLFSQERPMLDLVISDKFMLVLDPVSVSRYEQQGDSWISRESVALTAIKPWPRDLRGRLRVDGNSFIAWLPDTVCSGKINPLALTCAGGPVRVPMELGEAEFAPGRNFFVKEGLPPFYAVAAAAEPAGKYWILTGLYGKASLFDEALEMVADSIADWGSDIAGIESDCGSKRQVLATLRTDAEEPGAVQAFELANRQTMPLGPPVSFSGPVTALWTTGERTRVLAISRNLRLGRYEAFHLLVSCSR